MSTTQSNVVANQEIDEALTFGADDVLTHAADLIAVSSRFARRAAATTYASRSMVSWRTLGSLDLDGPQRVTELAARERVTQSTMSEIIGRLETDGCITREKDPTDGRAQLIDITDKGRNELYQNRREAAENLRPALERLTSFDRAVLARATELMVQLWHAPELS